MSETSAYYGGLPTHGGKGTLEKYNDGFRSAEKEKLIRNIAEDVFGALKIRNVNAKTAPIDKIIDALKTQLPHPGGKQLTGVAKHHVEICKAFATAINKRNGRSIVDTEAAPAEICNAVGTAMGSLFTAMVQEFTEVVTDVKRELHNTQILENSIESGVEKLKDLIDESGDAATSAQGDATYTLVKDLLKYLRLHSSNLAQLIGTTIDPTTKTIADLTIKDKDHRTLMTSLKGEAGSTSVTDKMTYLLAGINSPAILANTVGKAMDTVGLPRSDYDKLRGLSTIRDKMYDVYMKKHDHPSATELAQLVAAVEIVTNADFAHDDIAKYINKKAGELNSRTPKTGGAEVKTSLESRITRQKKTRQVLLRDFGSRIENNYREIMKAVEVLAKRLGGAGVPLDDLFATFMLAFEDLGEDKAWERENFYLALSGYHTDPVSKDERARFLGKLNAVSRAITPLTKGTAAAEYFTAIKRSIDKLQEIIDQFTDGYLSALNDIAVKNLPTIDVPKVLGQGALQSTSRLEDAEFPERPDNMEMDGGARKKESKVAPSSDFEDEMDDSVDMDAIADIDEIAGGDSTAYITIAQAVKHLKYAYRAARIDSGLKISSQELKGYSKDYEQTLGDAMGNLIIKIKKEYDEQRTAYEDKLKGTGKWLEQWVKMPPMTAVDATAANISYPNPGGGVAWVGKVVGDPLVEFLESTDGKTLAETRIARTAIKDNALRLMKEQMLVKVELLKTIEAIDLYLLNFTQGITANPKDIKDLSELLSSVDIVAKWFTEKSGDSITEVFESFPSNLNGPKEILSGYKVSSSHYFDWVSEKMTKADAKEGSMPGNPFLARLPEAIAGKEGSVADEILDKLNKAVRNFRVMDNIIATFAKLGSQFGNIRPAEKTFMAPGVMFKNLRNYMVQSSITMGWDAPIGDGLINYPGAPDIESKDAPTLFFGSPALAAVGAMVSARPIGPIHAGVEAKWGTGAGYAASTVLDYTTTPHDMVLSHWARRQFGIAMTSIGDEQKKPLNGFKDSWSQTNEFFIMAIKSMVSKVFVTIGTFGIMHKPIDKYTGLNTIRLMLGGSTETPEVIPEALELYIRLVLLAETYRDLFEFKRKDIADDAGKRITMIPDFDGVFSGFLKIIFDDAKSVTEGVYSETQVRKLIAEINMIYKRYKSPGDRATITDTVNAFVAEINRRWGVIKQKEINAYEDEKKRADFQDYAPEERMEYNILDEKDVEGRRMAPSDKFDTFRSIEPKVNPESDYDNNMLKLVTDFRANFDRQLRSAQKLYKDVSYVELIRQYKEQLIACKDNSERYKIVLKAMQGVERLSMVEQYKGTMFHETVIAPLGSLYTLQTVLAKFQTDIEGLDLAGAEKLLRTGLENPTGLGAKNAHDLGHIDALIIVPAALRYGELLDQGYEPDVTNAAALGGPGVIVQGPHVYRHSYKKGPRPTAAVLGLMTGANTRILAYQGTYGATEHLTWGDIGAIDTHDEKLHANNREGIIRFAFDRERIFKELINTVFRLHVDVGSDLVNIKVDDRTISIDFNPLVENIKTLLTHVKKNIEKFRSVIDKKVLKRFEGGTEPGTTGDIRLTPGSIYWLEEHLIERLVKGRPVPNSTVESTTFGRLNEIIQSTYASLNRKWPVLARVIDGGTTFDVPVPDPVDKSTLLGKLDSARSKHEMSLLRTSYDVPMADLTFWGLRSQTKQEITRNAAAVANPSLPIDHVWYHRQGGGAVESPDLKRWLYQVVPVMGSTDIPDLKQFKTLDEELLIAAREIFRSAQVAGTTQPFSTIAGGPLPNYNPDPAEDFYGRTMRGPGPWLATGAVVISTLISPFVDTMNDNQPVAWSAVNTDQSNVHLPDGLEAKAGNPTSDRIIGIYKRYQTLFAQRDVLRSSTTAAPLPHRVKWYRDPESPNGEWLSTQGPLEPNEREDSREAGLLVAINELLARYLNMGWDPMSRKMYKGLIDKFANGSHATALKGAAINDIYPFQSPTKQATLEDTNLLGVPPLHVTVFASLARFSRNIMNVTKPNSTDAAFRIDSLMDVPLNMKELFRADLPGFSKLFRFVLQKAAFLRQIAQNVSLVRQFGTADKPGIYRGVARAGWNLLTDVDGNIAGALGVASLMHRNGETLFPHQFLLTTGQWYHASGFMTRETTAGAAPNVDWITGAPGTDEAKTNTVRVAAQLKVLRFDRAEAYAYQAFAPAHELGEDAARKWYTSLLDDISGLAVSLDKCATDVYKDLGDEPKYLEVHEGSILDYSTLHKKRPIGLLSQLQIALRPRFSAENQEWDHTTKTGYARPNYMLPFYRSGEQPFKLLYGSRLVYNRPDVKPTLDYMPGMADLLERYNGTTTGDNRMDKGEFEQLVLAHTTLIRFLADYRHYKPAIGFPSGFETSLGVWKQAPYAMRATLDEVLALTESSSQDVSLGDIIKSFQNDVARTLTRKDARILNIIDLNIVPINFHALMKDVPLANLYNYSYTTDRIMQDTLMKDTTDRLDVKTPAVSAVGLMTKMLIYPFAQLDKSEFYGLFGRIATGDTGMSDLSRPKFIGDQLWGKALLQDLYSTSVEYETKSIGRPDEAGPRTDTSQSRVLRITRAPVVARTPGQLVTDLVGLDANPQAWMNGFSSPSQIETYARGILGFPANSPDSKVLTSTRDFTDLKNATGATMQFIHDFASDVRTAGNWDRATINTFAVGAYAGVIPGAAAVGIAAPINLGGWTAAAANAHNAGISVAPGTITTPRPAANYHMLIDPARLDTILTLGVAGITAPNFRTYVAALETRYPSSVKFYNIINGTFHPANVLQLFNRFVIGLRLLIIDALTGDLRGARHAFAPVRTRSLQYLVADDSADVSELKSVSLTPANPNPRAVINSTEVMLRSDIGAVGRLRFDTTFNRYLIWFTQIQRVMRQSMREEISHLESPVVNGDAVLNRMITEFVGNEKFQHSTYN